MISVKVMDLCPMSDDKFVCAIIVARYQGKWLFVRGKGEETWELPGGTHEKGEDINETASRELFEETGAIKFILTPLYISSVNIDGCQTYGLLFYCEISELCELPDSEIEEVRLFDSLPDKLTYPTIHNVLFKKVLESYDFS